MLRACSQHDLTRAYIRDWGGGLFFQTRLGAVERYAEERRSLCHINTPYKKIQTPGGNLHDNDDGELSGDGNPICDGVRLPAPIPKVEWETQPEMATPSVSWGCEGNYSDGIYF